MKFMKCIAAAALLSLTALAVSCNKDPQQGGKTDTFTLTATPDSDGDVPADGGTLTITVKTNADWSASASAAWVKLQSASGSKDGKITVTVSPNAGTEARSATVTVCAGKDYNSDGIVNEEDNTAGSKVVKQAVTVKQAGAKAAPAAELKVDKTSLSIAASGATETLTVTSNTKWTVTASDSFVTVTPASGENNGSVSVKVASNTAAAKRSATVDFAYGEGKKVSVAVSQDAAAVNPPAPGELKADLFDWVVNDDKSAKDVSAAGLTVVHQDGASYAGEKISVQKNTKTGLNDAYFVPVNKSGEEVTASTTSYGGYYSAKYEDNAAYAAKLADGHSIECYFCPDFNRTDDATTEKEIKPFSTMQSGGTGFLLAKASHVSGHGHFCFIVNTDGATAGFKWTDCGYEPERGKWHHAVGVYDRNAEKIYLYMDGELKSTGEAPGNYVQPAAKAGYWIVGGDPTNNDGASCTAAFKGNIAIARAYDSVLTADQVKELYNKVK